MEASNLQELKDAAIELMKYTCNSCEQRYCEEDVEEEDGRSIPSPCSAIIRMRNALSVNPIRQCDVGTVAEQAERFDAFCQSNMQSYKDMFGHDDEGRLDGWDCREDCPVGRMIDSGTAVPDRCQLAWAQMPYNESEAAK